MKSMNMRRPITEDPYCNKHSKTHDDTKHNIRELAFTFGSPYFTTYLEVCVVILERGAGCCVLLLLLLLLCVVVSAAVVCVCVSVRRLPAAGWLSAIQASKRELEIKLSPQ
jgi:hypothetical protein